MCSNARILADSMLFVSVISFHARILTTHRLHGDKRFRPPPKNKLFNQSILWQNLFTVKRPADGTRQSAEASADF